MDASKQSDLTEGDSQTEEINITKDDQNTEADEEVSKRTSTRERHPTEQYVEWQIEQCEKNFNAAISAWRKRAIQVEKLIGDSRDIAELKQARNQLEDSMTVVSSDYQRLSQLLVPIHKQSVAFGKHDIVERDHHHLVRIIGEFIRELQTERSELGSKCSKKSQTQKSQLSMQSNTSNLSKKIEAATEAATIKAELKHMELEAAKQLELEKVRAMKMLDIAEAKYEAIVKVEQEAVYSDMYETRSLPISEGMKQEYTERYVQSLQDTNVPTSHSSTTVVNTAASVLPANVPTCVAGASQQSGMTMHSFSSHELNPMVGEFGPTSTASPTIRGNTFQPRVTWAYSSVLPATVPTSSVNDSFRYAPDRHFVPQNSEPATGSQVQFLDFAKSFAEQINLGRLPPPEPGIFTGDPLSYPSWRAAFETLIEQRGIPPSERIHYLKKYLAGSAKEAVEGYFLLTTDDAFEEAKQLLRQRYGDPFVVANAFRDRLDAWPKIPPRDGIALRNFSDFLRQCDTAMQTIGSLHVLNDDRENRKMLNKLPDWLIPRWARTVADWKEKKCCFPPFKEFVTFIVKEANIACDPVTSFQAVKGNRSTDIEKRKPERGHQKRTSGASAFSTEVTETQKRDDKENRYKAKSCLLCKKGHKLDDCRAFLDKPLSERKEFAKEKGLCFGCLGQGHRSKFCKHKETCQICSKRHPTALHGDIRGSIRSDKPETKEETIVKSMSSRTKVSRLSDTTNASKCSMIVPVWISHKDQPDNEILVYALLDTQSDTTFILEDTLNFLGVSGPHVKLLLSTMYSHDQPVASQKISGLIVRGFDNSVSIELPVSYSREIMPANRHHIPTPEMAKQWPHLEDIANKIMPLNDNAQVGILIGYNCSRALAPRDVIPPVRDEPYAQRTDLGWGIVGIIDPNQSEDHDDPIGVSHRVMSREDPQLSITSDSAHLHSVQFAVKTTIKEVYTPADITRMMELDFNEHKSLSPQLSRDDQRFLNRMRETIHMSDDNHYEMPLPFRELEPELPNNRAMAIHRLNHMKKRLKRDEGYHRDYAEFMEKVISSDFAEKVPVSELQREGGKWYIPHHGVYHPRKPEKIRVVFDCSAKYKGASLNDHLLQGPDLTNTLVGVLCRFRLEPVALLCDIEQMFFQFRVNAEHRDYLRFLWWENADCDREPTEYRMKVHLFGAASSPGCANFGLKQVAEDNEQEFGTETAEFIRRDFYVDDGLKSLPTVEAAVDLIDKSRRICAKAGIRLHKFLSNSKDVIASIPLDDQAKGIKSLDLSHDRLPVERALGIQWCVESDTFQFRITLKDQPLTRRGVLSTISAIYDPLGFIAPVILVGKQILQKMCRDNADWDDPLPEELHSRWEQWRGSLFHLENLKIQRCFKPDGFGTVKSAELHHFSDASTQGYGQCSYLRLTDDQGNIHCSFVMGKARVAPLRTITIPRLELTAALVSVKISAILQRELVINNVTETFWCDSKVVLAYLANDSRRFHVFVANRVQQIRDHSNVSQWKYVRTCDNPADDASRGLSAEEMVNRSSWSAGPKFLWKTDIDAVDEEDLNVSLVGDPEVKQAEVLATVSQETADQSKADIHRIVNYYSSWHRLRTAVAVWLKLQTILLQRISKGVSTSQGAANDLSKAEVTVIKLVQQECFKDELATLRSFKGEKCDRKQTVERKKTLKNTSSLFRLDPYLDDDGVMRVGGRLKSASLPENVKHPVILPQKHHVTLLIIRHFHERVQHQGRGITTNDIRSHGYWIIGCSSAVSSYIRSCVICRKLRSAVEEQKMADIPQDRSETAPPFTFCAVDYFGPWYIKDGRRELKRYGVLFTCMACRAIHVETASALTTDSFISALRRFLAIRGPIQQLRSDQGTNFVGAARELTEALEQMDHTQIENFLQRRDCSYFRFKMNVPSASHMGGIWERQIRSVRNVLSALMNQAGSQLDDESLRTFMAEAAAIVNSRPLTVDNLNDPMSLVPLSPNQLLTMKANVILPPPGNFQKEDLYSRKRWRRVQHLANEFWTRWRKEFLQNLQQRPKWNRLRRNMKIGDIASIKDDNMPRCQWLLGRVVETTKDDDDLVRKVRLAIADKSRDSKGKRVNPESYLDRPIQKLVLLLENENTCV